MVYPRWQQLIKLVLSEGLTALREVGGVTDADVEEDSTAMEAWQQLRDKLRFVAMSMLGTAFVNADVQVGMYGFHRGQLINAKWDKDFIQLFECILDQTAGKGRVDGPLHAERARHLHSSYGPFCVTNMHLEKATHFGDADDTWSFLGKLHSNLGLWLGDSDCHGGCSMCAWLILDKLLNILWHISMFRSNSDSRCGCPRDLGKWALESRPQAAALAPVCIVLEYTSAHSILHYDSGLSQSILTRAVGVYSQTGYILPTISWPRGSRKQSLWDTNLNVTFVHEGVLKAPTLESKLLRMLMTIAWNEPELGSDEEGLVWIRRLPNVGVQRVQHRKITSHSKKRGASQNLANAGAILPITVALSKHMSVETTLVYQQLQSLEFDQFRPTSMLRVCILSDDRLMYTCRDVGILHCTRSILQLYTSKTSRMLLCAPLHLRPRMRPASTLDILHALTALERRVHATLSDAVTSMSTNFNQAMAAQLNMQSQLVQTMREMCVMFMHTTSVTAAPSLTGGVTELMKSLVIVQQAQEQVAASSTLFLERQAKVNENARQLDKVAFGPNQGMEGESQPVDKAPTTQTEEETNLGLFSARGSHTFSSVAGVPAAAAPAASHGAGLTETELSGQGLMAFGSGGGAGPSHYGGGAGSLQVVWRVHP